MFGACHETIAEAVNSNFSSTLKGTFFGNLILTPESIINPPVLAM